MIWKDSGQGIENRVFPRLISRFATNYTIPSSNKKFQVEFCTVSHRKNGKIDEENLFYG
jgi:hypothetical protein